MLGNQGACVIAKSYEMKAAGVKTGEPIWEAVEKCPQGIYVKRVIKSTEGKQIERTVFYKSPEEQKAAIASGSSEAAQKRERIIKRAAQELKDGMYVGRKIEPMH